MDRGADPKLEAFFDAVRRRRVPDVQRMLEDEPSWANAFDPDPWCCRGTPLNRAVSTGSTELVDLLLEAGADPNLKSDWWAGGFAPLHSVGPFSQEIVRRLLEAGARVDVHAAAHLNLRERLEELLDAWPDLVNAPGGDGGRPLHFAATPELADLLLDRGAWIEARCVDHYSTPAQWAVGRRAAVARRLLDRGATGDPFLYAGIDDVERLGAALDADPGLTDARMSEELLASPGSKAGHMYRYVLGDEGYTLVHVAAARGSVGAIALLVERGADLTARGGYDEQQPLHSAAWHDQPEAVRSLLELGADPEAASGPEHGTRPLVWAIVGGSLAAVRALVESGVPIRPHDLEEAEAGLAGEFDDFTKGRPDDFRAILTLLEDASASGT